VGSSRSSANRSRSSERSLPEARQVIGERLRARRDEIEQELLASVDAFSQDESVDPEYAVGLRDSVSVALEYGIECIESSERSTPPLPTSLYAQARLAARNGVKLDTVLERYIAGYTLLDVFLEKAAVAERVIGSAAYSEMRRVSSMLIRRLIPDISNQYRDEIRRQAASPGSAQVKQISELLGGKPVDTAQLNYDFDGFHIGLIAMGSGAANVIRGLAQALDCIPLIADPPNSPVWAWLGRRVPPDISRLEKLISKRWPSKSSVAIGEIGSNLAGWRLSHHQAKAGFVLSVKRNSCFFRYGDDPLLATLVSNPLLAESFRQMYISPLMAVSDGAKFRETLRAFFAANRNRASAAAALGVKRQTVAYRLKQAEKIIGYTLADRAAEIEVALRLDELGS
jgi:hypothetical protein